MTDRRIAVVGCGGAGEQHVDALARAGIVPAALVDPDAQRRAALGRRWPGVRLAASADQVDDAFDVAIVAAPDVVHPSVTIELLRAGKDVLVEKPMAGTRAEAAAMIAAAESSGRLLAVAHVRRHRPVAGWAFDVLRSGVLGAVERVDAAQGGRDDWVAASAGYVDQAAGGVVADQGAHAFDLLSWWFGSLSVVSCVDDDRGGHEAEASIELLSGDVPIHLELSRIRSKRNTVRVHTERGLLEVALDHYQPRQLVAVPDGLGIAPLVDVADDLARQFDQQLQAFLDALDGSWPSRLATAAEGAEVARLVEETYACRSSQEPWWMPSAATGAAAGTVVDAARPGHQDAGPIAVLGATGAVGSRFVEVVAGAGRAPVRALVHRWWHTARLDRFPVELRDWPASGDATAATALTAGLRGCAAAVSFIDGPDADAALAESVVESCGRAGVGRLVHLGCLGSFGAVTGGRLNEAIDPPRPPGADAARRWTFEQALLRAGERTGLDVVVVASPLVYGPFTERGAHIPRDAVARGRVAIARGSGPCHLVYVDDVVEAMWAAASAPGPVNGRIFISGPAPTTWPAFFAAFEPIVGRPAVAELDDEELAALLASDPATRDEMRWPPRPSAGRRVVGAVGRRIGRPGTARPARRRLVLPEPDELTARAMHVEVPLDRAAAALGWMPLVDIDEGMRRTVAYLRWADPR